MSRSVFHVAATAILLLSSAGAHSAPKGPPRPADLKSVMSRPGTFKDQAVVVTGMQCVEDRSYFVCMRPVGGAFLRFRSLSLGADTPQKDIEHFIAECSGTINFESAACKFDVRLSRVSNGERETVDISSGSAVMVTLRGSEIDFWRSKD